MKKNIFIRKSSTKMFLSLFCATLLMSSCGAPQSTEEDETKNQTDSTSVTNVDDETSSPCISIPLNLRSYWDDAVQNDSIAKHALTSFGSAFPSNKLSTDCYGDTIIALLGLTPPNTGVPQELYLLLHNYKDGEITNGIAYLPASDTLKHLPNLTLADTIHSLDSIGITHARKRITAWNDETKRNNYITKAYASNGGSQVLKGFIVKSEDVNIGDQHIFYLGLIENTDGSVTPDLLIYDIINQSFINRFAEGDGGEGAVEDLTKPIPPYKP